MAEADKGFFKFFKVNCECREFMYLDQAENKDELKPFINYVKQQGDIYRITRERGYYIIWDARK